MANFIRDDLAKVGVRVTLALQEFNGVMANLPVASPNSMIAARWSAAYQPPTPTPIRAPSGPTA